MLTEASMLLRTLVIAALLAGLPLASRAADPPSIEERLRLLEERVKALEAENATLKADAAPKPNTPAVVEAAGKETEVKLAGLLQVQAEVGGRGDSRFSDDNDRLFLRRARLALSGRFLEDVEWRTEMELAGTLASTSALRAQLTDGYVAWKPSERFDVRAGQFKTPFGFEQLYQDARLASPERTLGSDRLTLGRQLGVQLAGSELKKRFSWSAGAFNGNASNTSGNDDDRFLLAGRLSGVPATWRVGRKDARWAVGVDAYGSKDASVTLGPDFKFDSNPSQPGIDNVFAGKRHAISVDTQLLLGSFELWGAWIQSDFEPKDALPRSRLQSRARSVQATYLTWKDRLQLVARWDDFDPNRSVEPDATRTWTSGVTWLIRGNDLKLQADWVDVHGPDSAGEESKFIVRFQLGF